MEALLTKEDINKQIVDLPDKFTLDELVTKLILVEKINLAKKQITEGKFIEDIDLDQIIEKMVKILWSHLAIEELKEIHDYIAKDSKIYAKREVNKIRQKVKYLSQFPLLGKYVIETGTKNREIISGNYRIIYEIISENVIEILTIHHSSRDLSNRELN